MSDVPEGRDGISVAASAVLLEREREVATLDSFVSGVVQGGRRAGLIEGPAGIGKTTLLAEARRLAESDGIRVLAARGSELEREFPYGLVRQLFEPVLADPQVRERRLRGSRRARRGGVRGAGERRARRPANPTPGSPACTGSTG